MPSGDTAWLFLPLIVTAALIAAAAITVFRLAQAVQRGLDRIASRTHEPFVTASLEPSPADRDHVNLVVENCGFAPAFDVRVAMTPEIPAEERHQDRPSDWRDASLLRPGQVIAGYACRADQLTDLDFLIEVSWKDRPQASGRTSLEYPLDMHRYRHQAPFAAPSARDELLSELRSLRRDWRPLARGDRPLRVEVSAEALQAFLQHFPGGDREDTRRKERRGERAEQDRTGRRRGREDSKGAQVSLSEVSPSRQASEG